MADLQYQQQFSNQGYLNLKLHDNGDGSYSPVYYEGGSADWTRSTTTATISNGASVSGTVDLTGTAMLAFFTPSAWTSAAITLEVSPDSSTWYTLVYDATSLSVGYWPAANVIVSSAYSVDAQSMLPYRYVRFRSGTGAVPITQGADRVFTVVTRPLA